MAKVTATRTNGAKFVVLKTESWLSSENLQSVIDWCVANCPDAWQVTNFHAVSFTVPNEVELLLSLFAHTNHAVKVGYVADWVPSVAVDIPLTKGAK